jgi:hypothetical protein
MATDAPLADSSAEMPVSKAPVFFDIHCTDTTAKTTTCIASEVLEAEVADFLKLRVPQADHLVYEAVVCKKE